ncbi:hypothetical protein D3C71_1714940 [compost metagenome]
MLDGARLEDFRGHEIEHGVGVDALVCDGPSVDRFHALQHAAGLIASATGLHRFDGFHDLPGLQAGHRP